MNVNFRDSIITDKLIKLSSSQILKNSASLEWDNNTNILISLINNSGKISINNSALQIEGYFKSSPVNILITAAESKQDCFTKLEKYQKEQNLYKLVKQHWNLWIDSGEVSEFENANVYGLMPEKIYLNGSDCSDASPPHSWCCAEFSASLLELHKASWRK